MTLFDSVIRNLAGFYIEYGIYSLILVTLIGIFGAPLWTLIVIGFIGAVEGSVYFFRVLEYVETAEIPTIGRQNGRR